MAPLTRRALLQGAVAAAALAPFAGCAPLRSGFFSDLERQTLATLADAILPPDDTPGGAALGAVAYIERLLTALEQPQPFLWASGPYSGRQPFADDQGQPTTEFPPNSFAQPLTMDRVAQAGWRLALYGSDGLPGGGPNDAVLGKQPGLRSQVRDGLERALGATPGPLETWLGGPLAGSLQAFDLAPDFRDTLVSLVTQAAFAAPEYGGNPGGAGWRMIHFGGDSQPLGYSQLDVASGVHRERPDAPLSTPDPGADPDPLDAEARTLVEAIVLALGGQVFR